MVHEAAGLRGATKARVAPLDVHDVASEMSAESLRTSRCGPPQHLLICLAAARDQTKTTRPLLLAITTVDRARNARLALSFVLLPPWLSNLSYDV